MGNRELEVLGVVMDKKIKFGRYLDQFNKKNFFIIIHTVHGLKY